MTLGADHHTMHDPRRDGLGWTSGVGHRDDDSWTSDHDLVHLVLLDGRLVDSWSETAAGTRWEPLATKRTRPVVQLPRDESQDLLDWLTALCGSRRALDALTDQPLEPDPGDADPRTPTSTTDGGELDDLLERLGGSCFDGEVVVAMRRAAALVSAGRGVSASDLTTPQRASGIAWAVAKANGLLGPGLTSPGSIQHALGLTSSITISGRAVERALAGPLVLQPRRPSGMPDLLVLGRTDLLLGATRGALIAWREQAVAAHAAAAALHPCSRCSPD